MDRRFDTYRRDMDSLHYTPRQKARLASVAAAAAEQEQRHAERTRKPFRRTVLVTAVIVAALVCTAGATGVLKSVAEIFAPYFGGESQQTGILEAIGQPLDESVTQNGVTMTADAIMGDSHNTCIVYTISLDNSALPEDISTEDLLFDDLFFACEMDSGAASSFWFAKNENSAANQLQFVQVISSDNKLNPGAIQTQFKNLMYTTPDEIGEAACHTLAKGTWSFSIDADYPDSSVPLEGNAEFTLSDGHAARLTASSVSPFGMYIEWELPETTELPEATDRSHALEIVVTKTDGSTRFLTYHDHVHTQDENNAEMLDGGGSIRFTEDAAYFSNNMIFGEIIPLNEIQSITIGDTVYSVDI